MTIPINIDEVVAEFVQLRDRKSANRQAYLKREKEITDQMDQLQAKLLQALNEINASSVNTTHGTAIRNKKVRYYAPDRAAFEQFVLDYEAPFLYEPRIAQGAYREFIEQHPELTPPVAADAKYVVTVRRGKET